MGSSPPQLVLIHGKSTYLRERAEREHMDRAMRFTALPEFNRSHYQAESQLVAALQAARTLPMMAPYRVVLLKGLDKLKAAGWESLMDYCQSPHESTVLILVTEGFPRVRKGGTNWSVRLQNAVKDQGLLVNCSSDSVKIEIFAIQRASEAQKTLSHENAELLSQVVGDDLSVVAIEIEKLALFLGERVQIEAADIYELCAFMAAVDPWVLMGQIVSQDRENALLSLHRLVGSEGSSQVRSLFGLIAWQIRKVIEVAEAIYQGGSDWDIRKKLRVRTDLVSAVRARLKRGGFVPSQMLIALAVANRRMNSHRAGDRAILEALVLSLLSR